MMFSIQKKLFMIDIMSILNNRRFIGIELVKDYFEISKKRIEEVVG